MKKRSIKAIAIIAAFCVAFTSLPMMMGELESSAMAKKKAKVAKNVTVSASASGQTRAVIKWNKIKSPNNGYAVFRNGAVIAHMGKKYAFTDTGLKAGTAYTYQIRTYKTKKVKQWYNKATGKWQKKKPKKKWRGKSRKVTTYTYKKKSNVVTVRTAPLNIAAAHLQELQMITSTPSRAGRRPLPQLQVTRSILRSIQQRKTSFLHRRA